MNHWRPWSRHGLPGPSRRCYCPETERARWPVQGWDARTGKAGAIKISSRTDALPRPCPWRLPAAGFMISFEIARTSSRRDASIGVKVEGRAARRDPSQVGLSLWLLGGRPCSPGIHVTSWAVKKRCDLPIRRRARSRSGTAEWVGRWNGLAQVDARQTGIRAPAGPLQKAGSFVYRLRIPPFQGGEVGSIPTRAARKNDQGVGEPG